jgi:hypothetical protein
MKKLTLLSLFVVLVFICSSQIKIWSVSKDASQKANFAEIQAAIEAASPGDYIYVYSSVYMDSLIVNKPLVIAGTGYFLGDNPDTQVNKSPATVMGTVLITENSSGTIITGLNIENKVTLLNANNISVKRNRIHSIEINASNNIFIKQNFIYAVSKSYIKDQNVISSSIYVNNNSSSISIKNNYIGVPNLVYNNFITTESNTSTVVEYNVVYGHFEGENIVFNNNISLEGTKGTVNNCTYNNNISVSYQFGTGVNGNQGNIKLDEIFVGSKENASQDGRYQLKDGSKATGAGLNGVDCGMFGGTDPYVLSGLPAFPAIYFFEAPDGAGSGNGLPVHIKVKSH